MTTRRKKNVDILAHIKSYCEVDSNRCWLWQRGCFTDGYGKILYKGHHWRVHRLVYELTTASTADAFVLHTCDVKQCCNPDHLYLGDHQQNMRDRNARNRTARGTKVHSAKLNEIKVAAIRLLFSTGDFTKAALARMFGVNRRLIYFILDGEIWKHVPALINTTQSAEQSHVSQSSRQRANVGIS